MPPDSVLWTAVEKSPPEKFSEFGRRFPQVFHKRLWMFSASNYGRNEGFCTNSQALLLLLDLNRIHDLLVIVKGTRKKVAIRL